MTAEHLDTMIEMNLRIIYAEQYHPEVLTFLKDFICTVRDALFRSSPTSKDWMLSYLMGDELITSLQRANCGEGGKMQTHMQG